VQHSRDLIKDKDEARSLERKQRLHVSEDELRAELARLEARFAETPSDPELMLEISGVHERLNDPEAALELAQRAQQYRRDSFEIAARVGDLVTKVIKKRVRAADKAGQTEEASRLEAELLAHEVADYKKRVELRPGDAALRLKLAMKLMRVEQVDAAIAELQRCQSEPRLQQEALFHLAQCFQRKGILDLARKEYELALRGTSGMDERAKEILYSLGSIAAQLGQRDEARACYIRIYEVDIGYRDVSTKLQDLN
jgi:tetratricopeptide (TPR) repeat protein